MKSAPSKTAAVLASPASTHTLELDPLVIEAIQELDYTLIDWALSLSPRERLRACSKATAALGKFRHAPSPAG